MVKPLDPPRALDHVALLVPDLEPAAAGARALGLPVDPPQRFPSEGTCESYVGSGGARLLLLGPIGPGPYRDALTRRGPGLHHLALVTPDPVRLAQAAHGWLVHLASLEPSAGEGSQGAGKLRPTLWLARPGVGVLIEVTRGDPDAASPVVEAVEVPGADPGLAALLAGLLPADRLRPAAGPARLMIGGRWIEARGGLEALS